MSEKPVELAKKWNLEIYPHFEVRTWENDTLQFRRRLDINNEVVEIHLSHSPLVEPELIDRLLDEFLSLNLDYLWTENFPKGLEIEIYQCKVWSMFSKIDPGSELLTGKYSHILKEDGRPELFKTKVIEAEGIWDKPNFNLSVNSTKQLFLMRKIYDRLYKEEEIIDTKEVLKLYEEEPEFFEVIARDQIEIEATNDCNLKCIMCPRTSKMERELGYMDFDLFKKAIDEVEVGSVHFSGLGEPLLHPQIKEMFAYARDKGLEVGLWTNGLNLDEGFSKQIIEREFVDYIIFGFDASSKETYAKVKGVDLFDKAVENITRFLKLKKEKVAGMEKDTTGWWSRVKPIIGVQILKMKENDAEIEPFMDKWDFQDKARKMLNWKQKMEEVSKELKPLEEELNRIKDRLDWAEPAKGEISDVKKPKEVIGAEAKLSAKSQELMKPLNELYWKTFYEKFLPVEHAIIGHFNRYCDQIEDRSAIDVTPLKRFPCRQLKEGTSILWNGDAVVCRQDFDGNYPLGNLKKQSLDVILESNRLKEIWQRHKDGEYEKLPLCKDCKEWYYNLYA